jgi:hypothetical protein
MAPERRRARLPSKFDISQYLRVHASIEIVSSAEALAAGPTAITPLR